MVPCVENEASPSTNSALRTPPARARADIAYSLSPKTAVAVISPTGMRANEIVELASRFPSPCALSPAVAVINANAEPAARIVIWTVRERNIKLDPSQPTVLDLGSVRAAKRALLASTSPADRRILTQRLRLGEPN